MSQGLTWIAGRRTPLLALVALFALAVGMFAILQSATAADGSVSVEIEETADITIPAGYNDATSADVTVATVPASVSGTTVTISGEGAGTTTVTITDDDTSEAKLAALVYEVEVLSFGIAKVEFVDESDAVVKAGTSVTVRVTLQSQTANSEVRLTVPTTGLSIVSGTDVTTQALTKPTAGTTGGTTAKQAEWELYTAGAPDGEYTLTLTADRVSTDDGADTTKDVTATAVLTIGDAGQGLALVVLGPANVKDGLPSPDDDAEPDKTTQKAGSTIYLEVAASNSLGNASNPDDVDQVIVFAIGADIGDEKGAITGAEANSRTFSEDDDDTADDVVGAAHVFSVRSTEPAVITVRATVIGSSGSENADAVELVFTGDAETITLGEPNDQLGQKGDSITIELTAEDEAENPADISAIQTTSVKVLDADGNTAKNISATEAQKEDADGDEVDTALTITVSSDDTNKADTGAYTLEVKLGSKSTATAAFTVVGETADVAVSASQLSSDTIGDIITVTATLTDEDGNAVSDGISVDFSSSEGTGLAAIGKNHSDTSDKDDDSNGR